LLPFDFTREVPTTALRWLLQWGLPWSYWKDSIGYSPAEERLVFTIGTPLAFSIGRYVGEPNKSKRKWYVWGDCHRHAEIVGASSSAGTSADPRNYVVLVEDLISAHKVAAAGFTSLPLFGTNIHKPALYFLMQEQRPIMLWLDKDQQGKVNGKAVNLGMLTGQPVKIVISDNDPKSYSIATLKEILNY
jgi:hypothetical protein